MYDGSRFFSFFFFFSLFIVVRVQLSPFFPHHSTTPYPPPPPSLNPTPFWLCPWVLYTCSLMTLPLLSPVTLLPTPLWVIVSLFFISMSGYILFACFFCWLGSTYRWDHMVFIFYHVVYFTYHIWYGLITTATLILSQQSDIPDYCPSSSLCLWGLNQFWGLIPTFIFFWVSTSSWALSITLVLILSHLSLSQIP